MEEKESSEKFINLQKNLPSNIDLKFIIKNSNAEEFKLFTFLFNPFKIDFNEDYQFKRDYSYTFDFKEYGKYFTINRNIKNKLIYSLKNLIIFLIIVLILQK